MRGRTASDTSALDSFLAEHGWDAKEPHEEGGLSTSDGTRVAMCGNTPTKHFENDVVWGSICSMHKVTYDKKKYPYEHVKFQDYFVGKKRIWETRVQFRFKQQIDVKDVFFGIECDEFVPDAPKTTMQAIVRLLKSVVGEGIYHTVGDDPNLVSGERERPLFVMPLWAFDQFIVTPEDEDPPQLDDPFDIETRGKKRSGRVKQFAKEISALDLKPGPTFTFCMWGISQWLDKLNWQIRHSLLGRFDMNEFCGRPPVHLVIYMLKDKNNKRHLRSNRISMFKLAFWSSGDRPGEDACSTHSKIEDIMEGGNGDIAAGTSTESNGTPKSSVKRRSLERIPSPQTKNAGWCCTGR